MCEERTCDGPVRIIFEPRETHRLSSTMHFELLCPVLSMILTLRLLVLLTLPLLATPSHALAAQLYEGRWTEDPAWCRNTRASGTDELPITVTRRSIETFVFLLPRAVDGAHVARGLASAHKLPRRRPDRARAAHAGHLRAARKRQPPLSPRRHRCADPDAVSMTRVIALRLNPLHVHRNGNRGAVFDRTQKPSDLNAESRPACTGRLPSSGYQGMHPPWLPT